MSPDCAMWSAGRGLRPRRRPLRLGRRQGDEIFADKVGVIIGRDMSAQQRGALFIADMKSTGPFRWFPCTAAYQ
jgi:hypothetical protein